MKIAHLKRHAVILCVLLFISMVAFCSRGGKGSSKETKSEIETHEYVDLGLSVKWATCNVGATSPEEYGGYFAWGDVQMSDAYILGTYKYADKFNSGGFEFITGEVTKYCTNPIDGKVDNKTILEPSDDVARVNWGGSWRMPTKAEMDELKDENNCTWTWITQNDVNGYKVTSKKNGNSIFLPAAGIINNFLKTYAGEIGCYWSSSLTTVSSHLAFRLYFDSDKVDCINYNRFYGLSVRPVCE